MLPVQLSLDVVVLFVCCNKLIHRPALSLPVTGEPTEPGHVGLVLVIQVMLGLQISLQTT